MRALSAVAVGAWLLTACTEGALPAEVDAPAEEAPSPVNPTEVPWTNEPGAPRPTPPLPPRAAEARVSLEPATARELAAVSEVRVELEIRSAGQGTLDVEFLAPGSMPYEKRTVPVEAGPGETRTLRFILPVAGTVIPSSSLSGPWEVRFFFDGEPLTAAAFRL